MKTILTTSNGSKNKTWLKNRISKGIIIVREIDYKEISGKPEYKEILKEEVLNLLSGMRIYESDNGKISGAYGTSFYYEFYLITETTEKYKKLNYKTLHHGKVIETKAKRKNVKVLLNSENEEQPKEISHTFDKSNNNNNLKNKKMRNLVKFAVMFAIAPSEEDIEQLGYEPTKEEFKSYYSIEEDAAEDGSYQRSKDFDAFGDLFWMLNPEEKNELDPERVEEITQNDVPATQPENVESPETTETTPEVKEVPFVVPANLTDKYKEAQEEVKLCEKTLKDENKDLEKLKASNAKKVEKEQEKLDKVESKKDATKPETVLAFNNAKTALNLATKEASKTEKAQTSKVNKAQAQLDKANVSLTKLTDKIKAINLKDSLKSNKTPKTPKDKKDSKTKEQRWAEIEEIKKRFDAGDEVTFVDYNTKKVTPAIFKSHSIFWDDFPGALIKVKQEDGKGKTKKLSYNNLTLVKKAEKTTTETATEEKTI